MSADSWYFGKIDFSSSCKSFLKISILPSKSVDKYCSSGTTLWIFDLSEKCFSTQSLHRCIWQTSQYILATASLHRLQRTTSWALYRGSIVRGRAFSRAGVILQTKRTCCNCSWKYNWLNSYSGIQISQKVTYVSFTADSFPFSAYKLQSPSWWVPGCILFLLVTRMRSRGFFFIVKELTFVLKIIVFKELSSR